MHLCTESLAAGPKEEALRSLRAKAKLLRDTIPQILQGVAVRTREAFIGPVHEPNLHALGFRLEEGGSAGGG